MAEGETHQRIRNNLKTALSSFELKSSHCGEGRINLYHLKSGEKPEPKNWLSDVDLVLLSNGAIKILIEIKDKDITPKVILGIIEATDLATKCVVGKEEPKEVKDATLFIVVNSEALKGSGTRESQKPDQLELIGELMEKRLGNGCLKNLEIFTEFDQDEKDFRKLNERIQALIHRN